LGKKFQPLPTPKPLKEGIASEKWPEWCKQEEERIRKENELAQVTMLMCSLLESF
jgi:hypothetical protein